MPAISFKPGEFAHVADGSEQLRGHAHRIASEQLIPRIAERTKTAIRTIPAYMYFYSAIRGGRRCSCFDIEVSPSNLCSACFGTGTVGGYNKYGTALEIIDVTRPNIRTTNVIPDYSMRTRPTRFTLIDGAVHGSIEVRVEIGTNVGVLDALSSSYYTESGASLAAFVRGPADQEYVTLDQASLQQRLVNPWLDIKIDFDRVTAKNKPPYLDTVYIRYKTMTKNLIMVDLPRNESSTQLQEIGLVDEWSMMNFWLDNTLKSITTDDFFISESGATRWKIVSTKEFAPNGFLTSWDLNTRLIQKHEIYNKIPHVLPRQSKPRADWEPTCEDACGAPTQACR